ncbi:hypothetical protein [Bradyrhizobium genosp. P]|uniref:hypothetical protein n=1 Tax=Bradyrhizobium genosp. P TaxID=83641 RepID=UPI003CF25076
MADEAEGATPPGNPLSTAARAQNAVEARSAAAQWVFEILNVSAALPKDSPISEKDPLRLWGIASEEALVQIAARFNQTMAGQKTLRPPDLITNVFGNTVGALVEFIAKSVSDAAASIAKSGMLIEEYITGWSNTLRQKVDDLVLSTLREGYPTATRDTLLSGWRDGGASFLTVEQKFRGQVMDGDFHGLVNHAKFCLPADKYATLTTTENKKVRDIQSFFTSAAMKAGPPLRGLDADPES